MVYRRRVTFKTKIGRTVSFSARRIPIRRRISSSAIRRKTYRRR